MTTALERQEDGTFILTLTIPWSEIKTVYDQVVDEMAKVSEVSGFRKGKAPRKLVEEKLDKSKVFEEVIRRQIPKAYSDAISQENLRPIVTPKIELKSAQEGKDWIVTATSCQKPQITLGDYKKVVSETSSSRQKKIWTPGTEKNPAAKEDKKITLDEILGALYKSVKVTLSAILIEQEVNRLLADLVDQTQKLGLSVEQYLSSTNRTAEALRREYAEQAKKSLSLEFALEEIANSEGITVTDSDLEAVLKTAKSEEERKSLEANRYYLASVLRRQKTLDRLASL